MPRGACCLLVVAGLFLGGEAFLRTPSSRPANSSSVKWKKKKTRNSTESFVAEVTDPNSTCPSVSYIRIQKTGSSTLGECILPTVCMKYGQTVYAGSHMEFRRAKHKARDCMMTMLRDPVERFLSEFTFVRKHGVEDTGMVEQDQWDFDASDLPWLREIRDMADSGEALNRYLHYSRNPSRNRQALYILGFQRVPCQWDRCCGEQCSKPQYTAGFPAGEYDWDLDHDSLLARAKRHLLSMRAFGVADCFEESAGVIAKAFGWNATDMGLMAQAVHLRQSPKWDIMANFSRSSGSERIAAPAFLLQRHQTQLARRDSSDLSAEAGKVDAGSVLWRSFIREDLADEIRRVNRLDDELVTFAKQLLYERHGIVCGHGSNEFIEE